MAMWRAGFTKSALDVLGSVAFIAACAAIAWSAVKRPVVLTSSPAAANGPTRPKARPDMPLPAEPVSLAGAILEGNRQASIAVIEYSEFQCQYCGKFATETLPALKKKYIDSGKVLWVFRQFPLERIHPNALRAGAAGECAARQGKFAEMHASLFANQNDLTAERIDAHVTALGLDATDFASCMSGPGEAKVRADMQTGQSLGVTGTPTFLIGHVQPDGAVRVTRRLFGAASVAAFEQEIDAQLVTKTAARD